MALPHALCNQLACHLHVTYGRDAHLQQKEKHVNTNIHSVKSESRTCCLCFSFFDCS